MIKVLLFAENPSDTTSYYRGVAPFRQLAKQGYCTYDVVHPYSGVQPEWDVVIGYDIVFLQRPATTFALNLAKTALKIGIPVVIDFDDDLSGVPSYNPTSNYYNSQAAKTILNQIYNLKSSLTNKIAFTVSTPYLKERLVSYGASNVHVVPNALNVDIMGIPIYARNTTSVFDVSWRGSHTHDRDLYQWSNIINTSFDKVEYIGFEPIFIRNTDGFVPPAHVFEFYSQTLKERSRKFFFVVLEDIPFNRSKSNIAWIEATWAGSVVLAPDWEEWNKPGVITYDSQQDFVSKAYQMLTMDETKREQLWTASRNYIMENLKLTEINKKRIIAFESVM